MDDSPTSGPEQPINHDAHERWFTDESLRAIIREAVSLQEQRAEHYSESQVRSILAELGVAPPIVDEALRRAIVPASTSQLPRAMPVGHSAVLGVALGLTSATAVALIPGATLLLPFMWGAGVMFSGILAVRNGSVSFGRFQAANVALWSAMGGTFLFVLSAAQSMFVASGVHVAPRVFPILWAFTSAAGALLIRYKDSSSGPTRFSRIAKVIAGVRSSVVWRIKRWAESLTMSVEGVRTSN